MLTVQHLINELEKELPHLPVCFRVTNGARPGEYVPVGGVRVDNTDNQNTDGDPALGGNLDVILLTD